MGLRRGAAAWGCVGAQRAAAQWWEAAHGRIVGPRMGAARSAQGCSSVRLRRAAVWGGAAVGGMCRGAAAWGCAGAQCVAVQGRSAALCMGAAWGCPGAQQRGAAQGRSAEQPRGAASFR